MSWKVYFKDQKFLILAGLLSAVICQMVLFLFQAKPELQIFIFVLQMAGMWTGLFWDYHRKKGFYENLQKRLDSFQEKYLIQEMIKRPDFLEGKILWDVLAEMGKAMNDEIFRQIRKNQDFKRYVETWVHEVKLPIASMGLMLHKERGEQARLLKEQVNRIDEYVEQVLYYLRSRVPQKDYVIKEYSLGEIINRTIAKHKDSLIRNHVKVIQEVGDVKVLTDEKWTGFILGQLLSNSVKYRKQQEPCIRFFSEESDKVVLSLWDNGMGIPGEDVPRVFEHSFTGKNGRICQSSTGMGLYLCSRMCRMLGHRIAIESEEGEYTRVVLEFKRDSHIYPIS